ncbi:MAG: MFS transporter [Candidatus Asgardarchaeia archaeon]
MSQEDVAYESYIRRIYKWNVLGLVLSWILWTPFQSIGHSYFQIYAKALGATPFILSIISFSSTITVAFSRIIGGYISDKYGRKKIIVYLTFVVSAASLFYAFAPSWEWLLIGSIISSLALLYQPALWSIMSDSAPKENRGKIFSLYNFLPGIVSSLSPFLAIYLISKYEFLPAMRITYLLSFLMGVLIGVLRGILLKETLTSYTRRVIHNLGFKEAYKAALNFIKSSDVSIVIVIQVCIIMASSISFLIPYYAVDYLKISEIDWGYVLIVAGAMSIIFSLPVGHLIDWIGRKPVFLLSTSLFLAGYFLFYVNPQGIIMPLWLCTIAYSLISVGNTSFFITMNSITTDLVPPELRGRTNSVVSLISDVLSSFAVILGGLLYSHINPLFPFLVSSILTFVAVLIILLRLRETK